MKKRIKLKNLKNNFGLFLNNIIIKIIKIKKNYNIYKKLIRIF
jgi:hypothetical protein